MVTYTREQVYSETLTYFKGDELATEVWINKYCLKDSHNNYYELSPTDMHKRHAKEFYRTEQKYENPLQENEIFELLNEFKYIVPGGSPLSGIGNDFQLNSIANCFVIGNLDDSYGGICKTDEQQAQLMKRRGGVGHDLSHIRPKGSPVKNSALTSTGVVPFMERYSNTTREVAQDGRRGALMLSIHINHLDVEDFLNAKLDLKKITGANISVKVTDEFMTAVKNNSDFILRYPIETVIEPNSKIYKHPYNTVLKKGNVYLKRIKAKKIWDILIKNNWKSAEPGVLFWDTVVNNSTPDKYSMFKTISTNPCGEIPLSPNDSCRLLAVNLYSYVDNPFTKNATFNFTKFKNHVMIAQRLMDDILDLELEKIDKILEKIESDPETELTKRTETELWLNIKQSAIDGRRTGLGTTAWGDMFAALNMKYATDESNKFAKEVIKTKAIAEYSSSCILAKERGAFPVYNKELEKDDKFMNLLFSESTELKKLHDLYGRRNISISTQAPQGSTSLMTQSSSGIEPVFMLFYKRRKKINPNDTNVKVDFVDETGDKWTEYNVIHPKFIEYCNIVHNISREELQVMEEIKLNELIEQSPYYKSLVNDIDYIKSVELQGIVQSYISHSISKTANLPKSITEEEVSNLYLKAWEVGCKGFTIYRDGSRSGVLVSNEPTQTKEVIINRPKELPCDIHHITANGEKYYVIIGLLNDKPYELFAFSKKYISIPTIKKEGRLIKIKSGVYNLKYNGTTIENITEHFDSPQEDGFTRVISRMLRSNITIADICKDLDKSYSNVSSFYKAISRTLRKNYMTDDEIIKNNGNKCSDCGSTNLAIQEGCMICLDCGSSKCG